MSRAGLSILVACLAFVVSATSSWSWTQQFPFIGGIAETVPARLETEREFTLRHVYHHGSHKYPTLHRYIDDPSFVNIDNRGPTRNVLRVKTQPHQIQRLAKRNEADIDELFAFASLHGTPANLPPDAWVDEKINGPNITDKETILTFAKAAANAYVSTFPSNEWRPVKGGFNVSDDFGWELDGIRGHVFADKTNSTLIIGLKGTSTWLQEGDGGTNTHDQFNDNLFGSCCCGQGGSFLWKHVCNCMTSTYTCNSTCLETSIYDKSNYYWAARELYSNITLRYPNADVWLTGHSLGGVVSSLLGLTYGLPTLTFEAFPDALAAKRLRLPTPPGYGIDSIGARRSKTGVYHFGHTADPVYTGSCNGGTSICTLAGYAFQSLCHTGSICTYDTVTDLGWRASALRHGIDAVIKDVLEKYDSVPNCEEDLECQDCVLWKFFEGDNTTMPPITSTSSSTTSHTRTRTATCKTPGWWGCLDKTTTTTTSSSTTATCKTPGWFGCLDETTTTSTSSHLTTTPSALITTSAPTAAM